ncbi:carbamate kinase [Amylibacter sp. SFDW26]|uniref:carbamate kinase n=1 Tax=Amylibacter sp. SFDW26 TaxID=2652722 RepID=UPI001261F342|nr:carbamate kinase [Amylibacter sp. SFDW26]KAB7614426.1 carbamate kinase [Amylibacter sp. SFDW26]
MRVIIALGGNALLRRGERMTAKNQRVNIRAAAKSIVKIIRDGHQVVITHGNGPQIGLLALQMERQSDPTAFPLDVLGAETDGMIGYVLQQELDNLLGEKIEIATLLTQIEVKPSDTAFFKPTKPIGPIYTEEEAKRLKHQRGWHIAQDGEAWRRVIASPKPIRILEMGVIQKLVNLDVVVICAGGGGIPVVRRRDDSFFGVEAVIDKDRASCLLAEGLKADALLMLTDVDAVYSEWGSDNAKPIHHITSSDLKQMTFAEGSMAPKVEAAIRFVEKTGGVAGIGALSDASEILNGTKGTIVKQ